jgi:hypothetical protein
VRIGLCRGTDDAVPWAPWLHAGTRPLFFGET